MKQILQTVLISGNEVLLLEVVVVGRHLVVVPFVHDLIRVFWIVGSYLAVDEVILGNVVVGGLVAA